MDVSTIQAKLENGMYSTRKEIADDLRLVIDNCKTFNLPGTHIYKCAEIFEKQFNKGELAGPWLFLADLLSLDEYGKDVKPRYGSRSASTSPSSASA
jgi:hypothetical protein